MKPVYMTQKERVNRRQQIAEYAREHGVPAASKHFGVSESVGYSACREHNMTPKTQVMSRTKQSSLHIVKAMLDGVPQHEVAKQYNVTRQRVHQIRKLAIAAGFSFPSGE